MTHPLKRRRYLSSPYPVILKLLNFYDSERTDFVAFGYRLPTFCENTFNCLVSINNLAFPQTNTVESVFVHVTFNDFNE